MLGTQNVLSRWPNARVILASTCKACDPETAYGSSKLIAERMVLNAGGSVARFHNVIETRGNVFEHWDSLEGPLPVTPCRRYFIHLEDAVRLLQTVAVLPPGRYMIDPGEQRWMHDIASQFYPDAEQVPMEPRRGDRIREPYVAFNEFTMKTDFPFIYEIVNTHD